MLGFILFVGGGVDVGCSVLMLDLSLWLVEELTLFVGVVVDVGLVIVVGGGVDVGCSVVDVGLAIVVGGGVDVVCRGCCLCWTCYCSWWRS